MTWTIKARPHVAGAPMLAEYECPVHGRFELTVQRDELGDPPENAPCPGDAVPVRFAPTDGDYIGYAGAYRGVVKCETPSPWRISAPQLKRDSVPCFAEVRGGDTERRPGMLDTRPLAEGMSKKEWKARQRAATQERRHHELISKGLKTKRVQV